MIEKMTGLCIQETCHVERVFWSEIPNMCMQIRELEAHQGKGRAFFFGE